MTFNKCVSNWEFFYNHYFDEHVKESTLVMFKAFNTLFYDIK